MEKYEMNKQPKVTATFGTEGDGIVYTYDPKFDRVTLQFFFDGGFHEGELHEMTMDEFLKKLGFTREKQ